MLLGSMIYKQNSVGEQIERVSADILALILAQANFVPAQQGSNAHPGSELLNPVHFQKIRFSVTHREPITLILPAFPAKSPNPEKTCGADPDMGEVLALQSLQTLCSKIQSIYKPGAKIVICSDGRVFSDLVEVDDSTVTQYSKKIETIIEEFQFDHLSTFHLENIFETENFDDLREHMVRHFGPTLESVKNEVKTSDGARSLFNGIHRFILEDQKALHPEISKNQLSQISKEIAYQVVQRSNAWSKAVEEAFPAAVRLSIHPQQQSSYKLGITLLKSGNIWRTPWHSVAFYDGKDFVLTTKKAALDIGAKLHLFMGKYHYFSLEAV